jgi:hypothetical protein
MPRSTGPIQVFYPISDSPKGSSALCWLRAELGTALERCVSIAHSEILPRLLTEHRRKSRIGGIHKKKSPAAVLGARVGLV